ncbi:MAG TPA: HAMP domain-containing sensor histidine kinase, partial [Gemmataceae bacterium]|nr:HAMP domain-containing sensor histidine kinase [Gemmataceae bacterium]
TPLPPGERGRGEGAGECPFALAPLKPCSCAADALEKRTVVRVRDCAGLVHFAVPLVLGEEKLGALVAGQVFGQYPEQLELEHLAKALGLSAARVWEKARRQLPVSPSMLRSYEDRLVTLGRTSLLSRYHALLEKSHLEELRRAEEALRRANAELERRVEERTAALREAQKRVLQAERLAAIGQMMAGLAHESRNALQRIQAGVSLLDLHLQGQPDVLSLVNKIQRAQDDLHDLFEEVREYAAPIHVEPRPCDPAEVWRAAWADLAPDREGRDAELREELAGTALHCEASPSHLKQVFRNLLHNALSAARDPVRIVIHCSDAEVNGQPGVRVAVRDNGPGFTRGQRERAFEPFFTTKAKGTGLGLAICKRIVEAHGGRIEVGADGTPGAEVVITLPRKSP